MPARKGVPSWNAGLTKEIDPRVAHKPGHNNGWLGKKHSVETRAKMSRKKDELYATGWEPICGRAKKYDYESPVAGKIKVDGTWELAAARYFDRIGVTWERNRKRFPYVRPDGRAATYQPDFFVKEWDLYVEVKGYQTKLDEAKWSQFPHRLEVWKKAKIQEIW